LNPVLSGILANYRKRTIDRSVPKKPNGFWHVLSDCQRAGLPDPQEGVQTIGYSTEFARQCQQVFR